MLNFTRCHHLKQITQKCFSSAPVKVQTPTQLLFPRAFARALSGPSWHSTHALVGDKNIVLMGPPGPGKTTVGRMLGDKLGCCGHDVDGGVPEKTWNMRVSEKLQDVGNERFLEEDGKTVFNLSVSGSGISLSGSNPMHDASSMWHLKKNGTVVYVDVPLTDIISHLKSMGIDRSMGQNTGASLRD